jgi:hypothetical protein
MKRSVWLAITLVAVLQVAISPASLAAENVKHTETVRLGTETLRVNFSEFPLQAERSLDLTFLLESGNAGKVMLLRFIHPDGKLYRDDFRPLPHFPRDRQLWGFDSFALPDEGTYQLEFKLGGTNTVARLPLEVGPRPAGPPSNLILFLASLPLIAIFVLAARAWLRVKPLRQVDSRSW